MAVYTVPEALNKGGKGEKTGVRRGDTCQMKLSTHKLAMQVLIKIVAKNDPPLRLFHSQERQYVAAKRIKARVPIRK